MNKKQQLCSKILGVWDELCSNEPIILPDAKKLSYSFIINKKPVLTLSIKELLYMEKYVYAHFQKKSIVAERALADIGLWTFTECDDELL